jgi:hypothetical protein
VGYPVPVFEPHFPPAGWKGGGRAACPPPPSTHDQKPDGSGFSVVWRGACTRTNQDTPCYGASQQQPHRGPVHLTPINAHDFIVPYMTACLYEWLHRFVLTILKHVIYITSASFPPTGSRFRDHKGPSFQRQSRRCSLRACTAWQIWLIVTPYLKASSSSRPWSLGNGGKCFAHYFICTDSMQRPTFTRYSLARGYADQQGPMAHDLFIV